MRSPVYCHNLDIVAIAPDGQIGAFCIVWMDPVNKVGLFEPVGTHPDYQRKGLGKAVMVEGTPPPAGWWDEAGNRVHV